MKSKKLEEACHRFAEKFGHLPDVNYIWPGSKRISVGTALPHGKKLRAIPATFEGISVFQEPVRDEMDQFIATWSVILERIGGWAPAKVARWANHSHSCFKSPFFMHDSPLQYVALQLASERLRKVLPLIASIRIEDEIRAGLSQGADDWYPDLDPHYDWPAARERVKAAVRELEIKYFRR